MPFAYTLRQSARARNLRLTVYPDGRVALTVPRRASGRDVERFLAEKSPWVEATLARQSKLPPPLVPKGGRREYLARREEARALAEDLLTRWNKIYGFRWSRVSIRNQKTRWGSCSRRGSLSFNYRIVHLPPELADYLVVHELCHLAHMNHGPNFWAEVARAIPDYRQRAVALRSGRRLG